MERGTIIIFVFLLALSSGCFGGSSSEFSQEMSATSAPLSKMAGEMAFDDSFQVGMPEPARPSAEPEESFEEDVTGPKIIFTGTIDIEVRDFDLAYQKLKDIISASSGFVSDSYIYITPSGKKRGTITTRVPQAKFSELIDTLSELGVVKSQVISSDDVTLEYTDLSSRLKNFKEEEKRLLALLSQAQNVTEILLIEKELSRVRGQIEIIQGRLNYLNNKIDLATLTVILHEPEPLEPQPVNYRAQITVDNFDFAFELISEETSNAGGYLTNVQINEEDRRKFGRLSINAPQNKFYQIKTLLEGLGDVKGQSMAGVPSNESTALNAVFSISLTEKESLLKDLAGVGDDFKEALRMSILALASAINGAIVTLGGILPLLVLSAIGYAILASMSKKKYFVYLVLFLSFVFAENGGWIVTLLVLGYLFYKVVLSRKGRSTTQT